MSSQTVGIRTRRALPSEAMWWVRFVGIGTGVSAGVAVDSSPLHAKKYCCLFGCDEGSWALCFGRDLAMKGTGFIAAHADEERALRNAPSSCPHGRDADVTIRFRLSGGTALHVVLPGEDEELLLFDNICNASPIYVVASQLFGKSFVVIGEGEPPASPVSSSDLWQP